MSYMALYRKFRPKTFEQVKGQDHVVRTLKNQIKNNRIGHAYLFTGTRGTGKTSVAKLFARAINCQNPQDGEPCNCCDVCLSAARESFMDIVEVDAASNTGVDDIRRIIEEVRYTPVKGRYKVYIIDEVHMLSTSAFNAFLKTLEEPPSYAVFILATTEPHKLPITILSRCQRYDFHRISSETITQNLKMLVSEEGVEAEDKALAYIARVGDGSMRDSISLLDKCIAFNLGAKLTYETVLQTLGVVDTEVFSKMLRALLASDAVGPLKQLESAANDGKDLTQFVNDFIWYMRNLLLVNVGGSSCEDLIGVSSENLESLKEDARNADPRVLMRYIRILSELLNSLRNSMAKQILIEVALIKLAKPQMETDSQALFDRIRQLESAPVRTVSVPNAAPAFQPEAAYKAPASVNNETNLYGFMPEEGMIMGSDVGFEPQDNIFEPAGDWDVHPEVAQEQMPERQKEAVPMARTADFVTGTTAQSPETTARVSGTNDVCRSFNAIVRACSGIRLKMALQDSKPGEEDERGVTIFTPSGIKLETAKSMTGAIEELILKVTGCKKSVIIKPIEDMPLVSAGAPMGNNAQTTAFPEDLLQNINFDIGTEEI